MTLGRNVSVTNKSPTKTAVASLITGCCVGTATGIEDIDGGGDGNSYATPMPVEGILEEEEEREQRGGHHSTFYAAAAQQQQQQRNRFTSSPLIERDSSLIKEQSGLLSLLASGTFAETSPREITTNGNGNGNPHSLRRNTTPPTPSMTMMQTPPRSATRRKKHHLQQSSQYSPNNNTNYPPSPAMELSMARQSANATNQLLMSATPRKQRQQQRHRLGSSDSRSVNSAASSTRSHASNSVIMGSPMMKKQLAAMTIESPTKKARQEDNVSGNNGSNNNSSGSAMNNSIVMPNLDIDGVYSAENTVAPSPTATATTTKEPTAKTTAATTTMARSTIIPQTSSFSSNEIIMDGTQQYKSNIVIWKHYTKSRLDESMVDHLHHLELWSDTTTKDKKLNEEICNTYKFPRLYLQNPTLLGSKQLKELWWYKLTCGAESTLGHVNNSGNSNNEATVVFDPSVQPINVWSEPSASTMKVRGSTYAQDGIKVPSEESMFAVLGVDNYVNEKGSGGVRINSGTDSFMERWKNVCVEVGLESVPFL